jgi:hypothetical protein
MIRLADNLQIDLQKAAGQRFAVIGKSGSGKTNTLGVFVEEWVGAGLPATILDPMAQFHTLPVTLPVILAGRGKTAHVEITDENAAMLARLSAIHRVSVVIDLSLYTEDEAMEILRGYLESMWATIFAQENPQPYALVIDEAHLYAPQSGVTVLSKTIIDIAKRGRHKNLTTVVATQRAAAITKEFLTQATLLIAHRLSFGVDTGILQEQLPLPKQELNALMRKLATGEALVIGDAALVGDVDYLRVQVRERRSKTTDAPVSISAPSSNVADVLKLLAENKKEPDGDDGDPGALRDENRAFKSIIADQDEKIAALRALVSVLVATQRARIQETVVSEIKINQPDQPANGFTNQLVVSRQRGKLAQLVKSIRKVSKPERLLFVWLLEHPGRKVNSLDAGPRFGYSYLHLQKSPPKKLMEMKLIEREPADRGFDYFVSREKLAQQFPDLPIDHVVRDLAGVV